MESKTLAVIVIVIIVGAGAGYVVMFNPFGPQTNPYDVAVVFATGGLGDKSFNDGVMTGLEKAKTDFGINFTYAEPTAVSDYDVLQMHELTVRGYQKVLKLMNIST